MRSILLILFLMPVFSACAQSESFFNGKDLTGWKSSREGSWRVEENGELVGSLEKGTSYLWSDKSYKNFKLKFKVKTLNDATNSGVQFWSKPSKGHAEGYQADIGAGYWGKLYDHLRKGLVSTPPENKLEIKKDDWNDYEILAVDGHMVLTINGNVVVEYTEKDEGKISGPFALQIHRLPKFKQEKGVEVRFKDFVLTIDPEMPNVPKTREESKEK